MVARGILLAAAAVSALHAAPASACSMRFVSIFEQASQAEVIAIGRARRDGVAVLQVIKGYPSPGAVLPIVFGNTSCSPRLSPGERVLVFTRGDRLVAHYQSAVRLSARGKQPPRIDEATLQAELAPWIAATTPDAKAQILGRLLQEPQEHLAFDAGFYLAEHPELLAAVTPALRQGLTQALRTRLDRRTMPLSMVLARLHEPAAIPVLIDLIGSPDHGDSAAGSLEVLTNHHEPGYELENALMDEAPAVVQGRWRAWAAARQGVSGEELVRRGFSERGGAIDGSSAALARAVLTGPDLLTRAVAFEQCERAAGRSLFGFFNYSSGVADEFWATLARACETGRPHEH
jgi:hypothetical protein